MTRTARGFTLVELMIVVVVIGILAAIAIPNFIAMQTRAKEGATKSNMHTFQITAEDYSVQSNGLYPIAADSVATRLTGGFINPFDRTVGKDNAWEDRASVSGDATAIPGITSYADSATGMSYNIKAHGRPAQLTLVLSSGN